MSLILDALKKAEKERSDTTAETTNKPVFNPIAATETKSSRAAFKLPRSAQIVLLIVMIVGGGVYFGKDYFKNLMSDNTQAQSTALPKEQQPAVTSTDEQASSLKSEAIAAYKNGNFALSKEKWNQVIQLTPTDGDAYNNLGVVQKKMGDKDGASESYRTCLSLNPTHAEALNNLGVVMLEKLLNEEAEQLFEKSIQANPTYADPHFHLALVFEDKKDIQKAMEKYQSYINLAKEIDPELRSRIEMRMVTLQNF